MSTSNRDLRGPYSGGNAHVSKFKGKIESLFNDMVQPRFRNQSYVSPKCLRRLSMSGSVKDFLGCDISTCRAGGNIRYRICWKIPIFGLKPFRRDIELATLFFQKTSLDNDLLGKSDSSPLTRTT